MNERSPITRRLAGSWDGASWVRLRATSLSILLGMGLAAVLGRAIHLQVVQQDHLGSLARDQYLRTVELEPHRGEILDRAGGPLASSVEVESIFIDPQLLGAGPEAIMAAVEEIGRAAELSRERIRSLSQRALQPGNRFAWVRRKASPSVVARVRELGLSGVGTIKEARRFYPRRELASQVLGFVGADGQGLEGLERSLDRALRGQGARVAGLRDARGNALLAETSVPVEARSGATVTLTLDRTIQAAAEEALAGAMQRSQAKGASAVVLDVETGEVLALASMPTFNPNVIPGADARPGVRNRAIADAYEPGSAVKAFLMAGALERGAIRVDRRFDCENGRWRVGRHTIHDSKPHRLLDPEGILRVSSNICSGKIALELGAEALREIYADFGFGARTGIELPGETPGRLAEIRGEIGLVTASFGQGPVMASPLQVAVGFAAIANGGRLLKPWIVRSIVESDGAVVQQGAPQVIRQVISEETAATLRRWLESVVSEKGTAGKAAIPGYRVAGKTGTAQKVDPETGRYGEGRLASFAGFAPAQAPRVAIAVFIDEPTVGSAYGGQIAAPVFATIAERALATLGIPATEPIEAPEERPPSPKPRQQQAAEGWVAEGGGEAEPVAGAELVVVPELRGLFARAALRELAALRLEPRLEGAGRVTSQRPPAGSVVAVGSAVRIELEPL